MSCHSICIYVNRSMGTCLTLSLVWPVLLPSPRVVPLSGRFLLKLDSVFLLEEFSALLSSSGLNVALC